MRDWQSQSHVKWYCKYHERLTAYLSGWRGAITAIVRRRLCYGTWIAGFEGVCAVSSGNNGKSIANGKRN